MLALLKADARRIPLADESVQCVVTSPPYWGLRKYSGEQELVWGGRDCEHEWENLIQKRGAGGERDYGSYDGGVGRGPAVKLPESNTCLHCGAWRGAYGLEPTVEMYVQHTVEILREIRRVLRDDGVVFWNIGDSYATHTSKRSGQFGKDIKEGFDDIFRQKKTPAHLIAPGLKEKDLCLIPFRVALAAQADGWWIRSDIIWAKPNPMPESVTDRPTRSHEYILMLTKSARYFWDAEAVAEPQQMKPQNRLTPREANPDAKVHGMPLHRRPEGGTGEGNRNLRDVWTFTTEPYPEAHFATFPEELPKRCILAATRLGDLVLDPFAGSGTVGRVAIELGRRAILCDLAYQDLASKRTAAIQRPLLEASL